MHDAAGPLADNADLKDSDMAKRNCVLFHYLCVALTESAAHVVSQVAFGDGVQLWNRLQEIYASDSQASVMNMHSKLLNTRLSSFSSLADFVGALSAVLRQVEVAKADMTVPRAIACARLCEDLPSVFSPVIYEARTKRVTWDELCNNVRLFAGESYSASTTTAGGKDGHSAFAAYGSAGSGKRHPHTKRSAEAFRGKCNFCEAPGHRFRDCEQYKNAAKAAKARMTGASALSAAEGAPAMFYCVMPEETAASACCEGTAAGSSSPSEFVEFCVDSGASAHFVADANLFSEITKSSKAVVLANNTTVQTAGHGNVSVCASDNNLQAKPILLRDVHHLPGSVNLLSVSRLNNSGHTVVLGGKQPEICLAAGGTLPLTVPLKNKVGDKISMISGF